LLICPKFGICANAGHGQQLISSSLYEIIVADFDVRKQVVVAKTGAAGGANGRRKALFFYLLVFLAVTLLEYVDSRY
jgi:hypothetical protein